MVTLDFPDKSVEASISITLVIDTKAIPYGKQSQAKPYIRINSEHWPTGIHMVLDPDPVFYNAFPDLNEVAEDKSYSAAPKGAKYMLPLACIFNPYATYEVIDEIHPVANLEGYLRWKEDYGEASRPFLAVAREPSLEGEFKLSAMFEATHARLGATTYKLMFRANLLGPFYETLWQCLSSERQIRVPLLPNSKGSKLHRQWGEITNWFLRTCVLDEACSLLINVAYIADRQFRGEYEPLWVQKEDEEMQGKFAPFYHKLRSTVESLYGGTLDSCHRK